MAAVEGALARCFSPATPPLTVAGLMATAAELSAAKTPLYDNPMAWEEDSPAQ